MTDSIARSPASGKRFESWTVTSSTPMAEDSSNVTPIRQNLEELSARVRVDGGGGPPDDGSMRERVAKLEAILPMLATKADVGDLVAKIAESKFAIIAWLGAALIGVLAILLSAMFNWSKPGASTAATQPIVIQIPAPAPAPLKP